MRRRRARRWLLPMVLWALALGRSAPAQTAPTPPVPAYLPTPLPPPPPPPGPEGDTLQPLPPAPQPLPGPAATGLPPGGGDEAAPTGLPINLATAMQLAGVRPLDIAAATKQVEQSLAVLLQAKALWIPNLNGGVDYFRHDGVLQSIFTGENFQKGRQSLLVGGGPTLSVGLTDAIFAPLAARRVVSARKADLQAARNDSLFAVARAYFVVQEARGRVLGTEASIARAVLLVNFATGLAPSLIAPLEINRAQAELESLRQDRQAALRDWRVASAQLAEVLLIDPAALLEPIEPPFLQVTFVPPERSAEELMPIAIRSRPEIASRRELVAAAEQLLNREKKRPLLPNLIAVSPTTTTGLLAAGNYNAGANGSLNNSGSRFDIEVALVWQLQNGGVGNVGLIRQRRAEQDLASIELTRSVFRVKSEVAQAVARLQTARARVAATEDGVRQAIESADKNFIGLRETTRPAGELLRLIVRPQEVVAAIMALNTAYAQYSGAIGEYNAAQFDVYRAIGQPAQWVTCPKDAAASPGPTPPPPPPPTVGDNRPAQPAPRGILRRR